MEEVTLGIYMVVTFIVAISCTSVLVLMFWISDLIIKKRERKKRKTVWEFDNE